MKIIYVHHALRKKGNPPSQDDKIQSLQFFLLKKINNINVQAIKLKQRLKGNNTAISMFVNDAIGYRMESEQPLYYSMNCYGTADAISFSKQRGSDRMMLRIHDLKTGQTPAKMDQLMIYTALFCLEYGIKPGEIDIELRIYQGQDILYYNPKPEEVLPIMDLIIRFSKIIDEIKIQEGVK